MKILKMGDPKKIEAIRNPSNLPTRKVTCEVCECVFEVELGCKECYWDYNNDYTVTSCPCCGRCCVFR